MPKYRVTKCVDAFVHFSAIVDAPDPDQAILLAQKLDESLDWVEEGVSVYDEVDWSNIEPELVEDEAGNE